MWVDNKAVCQFDTGKEFARARCQNSGQSIGAINVKPNLILFCNLTDFVKAIDYSKICGSRSCNDCKDINVFGIAKGLLNCFAG